MLSSASGQGVPEALRALLKVIDRAPEGAETKETADVRQFVIVQEHAMQTRAAVAWKAGEPLSIETIDIEGPKAGEVLVEIKATGICHTDAYTFRAPIRKASSPRSSATRARASCARSAPASPR